MQITYDEWYERTVSLLLGSDIPRPFVEDYLTNRPAMHKLYQDGYAAAEVLMHISREYRLRKEASTAQRQQAIAEEYHRRMESIIARRRSKLENLRSQRRHIRYWALRCGFDLGGDIGDRLEFAIIVFVVLLLVAFGVVLVLSLSGLIPLP